MRKFYLALALAYAPLAAGCSTIPTAPVDLADQTVLDEQAGAGVELAYKAFRTALELAVDAGVLKGDAATKAAALDNRAYGAVLVVRKAYAAGNATDYYAATTTARAAITDALAAIKGN